MKRRIEITEITTDDIFHLRDDGYKDFSYSELVKKLRHIEILNEQGLPFEGKFYYSKTYGTPFTKRLPKKELPRYKALVDFQRRHQFFTIRQFYYHLIQSQDPNIRLNANTTRDSELAYAKTKRLVNRARLAGIIPFNSVLDDTDLLGTPQQFCTIEEYLQKKAEDYRSNWFVYQDCYLEVWLEKKALEGVIYPVTDCYGVYLSCSGKNPTLSQVYSAIQRFKQFNKPMNYILYLGDLDPQGKDMVRWLQEEAFKILEYDDKVEVIPLALNLEHANDPTLNLHRIPSLKGRRSVVEWYKKTYKIDYSIELDALDPTTLRKIVERGILERLDPIEIENRRKADKTAIENVKRKLEEK